MTNSGPVPQVVHLGKKSRKEIKMYRQGIGSMHLEVQQLIGHSKNMLGPGKEVLPLVVVHRKKKKKSFFSL
ncbi:MAG: hypothetical protein ACKVT2_11085 [Saprospiraceae bacterium]